MALNSPEHLLLAVAWILAAVLTLLVALTQSLPMFLIALASVLLGTYAALWLTGGEARR